MSMSSSSEITIKNGNSLLMNFIQRVSHPTKMTPCQKVALTTFSGGATGAIALGVALGFGAAVIMSAGIAAIAALVVMVAIAILISKKELSPKEKVTQYLALDRAREEAAKAYNNILNNEEDHSPEALKECAKKYKQALEKQLNHPLQPNKNGFVGTAGQTHVPGKAELRRSINDLSQLYQL